MRALPGNNSQWFWLYDFVDRFRDDWFILNVTRIVSLPTGLGADEAHTVLRALVSRHEILRMRPVQTPDAVLRYAVGSPDDLVPEIRRADDEALAVRVEQELRGRRVPYPFHAVICVVPGRVDVVIVANHGTVDGRSINVLVDDMRVMGENLLRGAEPTAGLPEPAQPSDVLAWQTSARGRARAEAARTHYLGALAEVPDSALYRATPDRGPGYWVVLESSALDGALRRLSDRLRVPRSALVLAATNRLLAACTGLSTLVWTVLTQKRPSENLRSFAGVSSQKAYAGFDVAADEEFAVYAARVWRTLLGAARHGDYDVPTFLQDRARIAHERGVDLNAGALMYNWRFVDPPEPFGDHPTEVHGYRRDIIAGSGTVLGLAVQGGRHGLQLRIGSRTALLPPTDLERIVRGIEQILCHSAADPLSRQPPADAYADWPRSVRLHSVTRPAAGPAVPAPAAGPAEASLVAALAHVGVGPEPDRGLSFFQLGGRPEHVPALRERLRRAGWEPPSWDAITSTAPLHQLALRMTPLRGPGSADRWRTLVPPPLCAAVDRLRERLSGGAAEPGDGPAIWVSGSWIEGLANPRSDLDAYVITAGRRSGSSEFLAEDTTYLDVETWSVAALADVAERVAAAAEGRVPLAGVALDDIDLYYRASIAVRVTDGGVDTSGLAFETHTAAVLLRRWCRLMAAAAVARAKIVAAEGFGDGADIFYRHAGWLVATAVLADDGEAYPSLKWALEKARRRYGTGSAAFADIERLTAGDPAHKQYRSHLSDLLCRLPDDGPAAPPSALPAGAARVVTLGGRSYVAAGRTKLRPVIPGLERAVGLVLDGGPEAAGALRRRYRDLSPDEAASFSACTTAETV